MRLRTPTWLQLNQWRTLGMVVWVAAGFAALLALLQACSAETPEPPAPAVTPAMGATPTESDPADSADRAGSSTIRHSPAGPVPVAPVITGHPLSRTGWGDPWVLKNGATYVMYLSRNLPTAAHDDAVSVFRATSPDGLTWTINDRPILSPGGKTAFDGFKIETASVVVFNGVHHLYYSGIGFDERMAIGHATSRDGITWTKDGRNPVLADKHITSALHGALVAEPGALVHNNRLHVYFSVTEPRMDGSGLKAAMSLWRATARDASGSTFEPPVKILSQGPLYPTTERYEGYSTPAPLLLDGRVHLFYSVFRSVPGKPDERHMVAIHRAVSSDGLTGWQEDAQPLMRAGDLAWATDEVYSPTVVAEGGQVRLWFSGNSINWTSSSVGGDGVGGMGIGLMPTVIAPSSTGQP